MLQETPQDQGKEGEASQGEESQGEASQGDESQGEASQGEASQEEQPATKVCGSFQQLSPLCVVCYGLYMYTIIL